MRIESITAKNFKSLVDFRLGLAKFSCLIGLNGAGKSTVLQFIDFLAQQTRGDIDEWLRQRSWRPRDMNSRLSYQKNIEFSVAVVTDEGQGGVTWKASFNTAKRYCTSERIVTPGAVLEVEKGHYQISDPQSPDANGRAEPISFSYQGSILSQLKDERLPDALVEFKNYFKSVRSLDLLSPESLRQRTRDAAGTLGLGGQRLAAFLYELGREKRAKIAARLKQVYKQLESIDSRSLRSGWKQLEITESYEGEEAGFLPRLTTEARHINDGMLRLIAILAELETQNHFLLFDEIENGINPELVEMVVNTLVDAQQQVLVTTHSPMILNYLDDETAKKGIVYLYKTPRGHTKSIPFFSIPSLAKKLTVMGPGEAFVDTNLTQLADEIAGLHSEEE